MANPSLDQKAFDEDTPSAPSSLRANLFEIESIPSNGNICPQGITYSGSFHAHLPTFHASTLGPWHSFIAYEACCRLCLHAWAKGHKEEALMFLENECALLRSAFNLQEVLLQSEEDLHVKCSSDGGSQGGAPKLKKTVAKMKVQVCKLRIALDPRLGCSFSHQSLAYMQAGFQFLKQALGLLKTDVSSLRSISSANEVQETYCCLLRLKSSGEEDTVRMQPGSSETHTFFPENHKDDLILEVHDSKGTHFGRVLVQLATILDDPNEKLRWLPIYREPEHEVVGKIQLYIAYTTSLDASIKCGSIAETLAYDIVMEVAMEVQNFRQRSLVLEKSWEWLLSEFASYYVVSDAYTKLRYLSYIMDVATPTADCLSLVYNLLSPLVMKVQINSTLSLLEKRMEGEIEVQIEQILAVVFANYKSLDENSPSGMMDVFRSATVVAPPVLEYAVKLYELTNDILTPEAQKKLSSYFQAAVKKRSRLHLTETDEYITGNGEGILMESVAVSTAYRKMKSLCLNIRNEIYTDIEIHSGNVLPSFLDLSNLSSSMYSAKLSSRLQDFLFACPPHAPSRHVADLVIATADFQKDLASWNVKSWVDAKDLFHQYILIWIEAKRVYLLKTCEGDEVAKWSGARTQRSATKFVDGIYDQIKNTINDYEVILSRWPEYTFTLENAVIDIEKAVIEALDKRYADVLVPLKTSMTPQKSVLKVLQKLTKTETSYTAPPKLGMLLNSMKRMLDVLCPEIELRLRPWGSSCIPDDGNVAAGERLSEVTAMLRSKFKSYLRMVAQKLVENTRLQKDTKIKKILQDSKQTDRDFEIRTRMQQLVEQLTSSMVDLDMIFERSVFISACREYWDQLGQDVLGCLQKWKENPEWYKGSTVAVTTCVQILDETFASQMQQLLGNKLEEKDLEPPTSIVEVRSFIL